MQFRLFHLALIAALGLSPAMAQETQSDTQAEETTAQEPASDATQSGENPLGVVLGTPVAEGTPAPTGGGLPTSRDEAQVGQEYLVGTEGDWQVLCAKAENGADPCQLYQLLRDASGGAVAEFSVFNIPNGNPAIAGATAVTPLGTLLNQQIALRVDGGGTKRYPFTFCLANGCFARIGFTADDIAAFRRGNQATVTIVPLAAPDQKVDLALSLTGFTAGYKRVEELNAENAAKAQEPAASE